MITQVNNNIIMNQVGVVKSGELVKVAAEQAGRQAGPVDTVQISGGKKEELPLTEREMKLLGKVKQKEFLHAFVSSKGMDSDDKMVLNFFGGALSSIMSYLGASSLGGPALVAIAAAVAAPVAFYLGASAFQGLGNARDAEKEWGKKFLDSSEKNSVKMVMDEYPSLGYRYQV